MGTVEKKVGTANVRILWTRDTERPGFRRDEDEAELQRQGETRKHEYGL